MKTLTKSLFYVLMFVLAVIFGSFVLVKTFGVAYEQQDDTKYQTSAESMILMEANSGRIIAEKDADKQLPMASLTKIITAIVAIKNTPDLDKEVEISKEAQGVEGSSIYLKSGEHLTMRELLYGLMLRSGNDAAVAIAIATSGSVEKFVEECNSFCASIGATNTHLVTPNGLHDDNHYTTARDLAEITKYALSNDIFSQIVKTPEIKIHNELGRFDHRLLINKNRFLKMVDGADGVKTGYTKKAGRCFVGSATRAEDNLKLICVLLNCRPMFEDCSRLIREAQKEYRNVDFSERVSEEKINIGEKVVSIKPLDSMIYPVTQEEDNQIEIKTQLMRDNSLPIKIGEKLAEVQIFLDKQMILCDNIYAAEDVSDTSYKGTLEKVIENF
ncbi:MAG: D-alanyl-D-alanine carboxypeptidase [Clostridia bacterium]|nr:D-alanyl-D-alanine carboxypeptidase [Clostridia bacterium]